MMKSLHIFAVCEDFIGRREKYFLQNTWIWQGTTQHISKYKKDKTLTQRLRENLAISIYC